MKQTLCDACRAVLDSGQVLGDEAPIYVIVTSDPHEGAWREYHRRCARQLTVAEVWARSGAVPL